MAKPTKDIFDPKKFLAKVGAGKRSSSFPRTGMCSSKGMSQTRCFTFKKAKSS